MNKLVDTVAGLTTLEDHIVLDPFIGSGTTAVACRRMNRRFIGFEATESHYQNALRRLGNAHSGG